MVEKYKLGLSRNRLFDFNSTVVFCGRFKCDIDKSEVHKAIKMLSCKEPVITANVSLEGDSQAFIVTEAVVQEVVFSSHPAKDIVCAYEKNPLCFCDRLFEFTISDDGYLIIAGHTVFCDVKSLLRLAVSFADFYDKTGLSVEPEEIYTFSEPKSLPVDVISPLVNKLSSELDDDWQKNAVSYSVDAFKSAREDFLRESSDVGRASFSISSEDVKAIRESCLAQEVDFSSLVCFSFYKAIRDTVKSDKKSSKMRIWADRRFFHGGNKKYSVGAYNGTVSVHLTKKELRKSEEEQLKLFHTDVYKALTSPFRVFSDEILLNSVQADYCDSAYMYMAGKNKFKSSKNLARAYGCMNEELCEFLYYNLTQQYWSRLSFFEDVFAVEPFKACRSRFSVTFAERAEECACELRYDKGRVTEAQAQEILRKAQMKLLGYKK